MKLLAPSVSNVEIWPLPHQSPYAKSAGLPSPSAPPSKSALGIPVTGITTSPVFLAASKASLVASPGNSASATVDTYNVGFSLAPPASDVSIFMPP